MLTESEIKSYTVDIPNDIQAAQRASGSLPRMVRPCVTHHHSCDCRERAIRALLEEVMWWHKDPNSGDYNGCDTDPCLFCELAKGLLDGTKNHDEIVRELHGSNDQALRPPEL